MHSKYPISWRHLRQVILSLAFCCQQNSNVIFFFASPRAGLPSVSCLGFNNGKATVCPKGGWMVGWGILRSKPNNSENTLQKPKPREHCKTCWAWLSGALESYEGALTWESLFFINVHTCCSFVLFVLLHVSVISLYVHPHYQDNSSYWSMAQSQHYYPNKGKNRLTYGSHWLPVIRPVCFLWPPWCFFSSAAPMPGSNQKEI